MRSLFFIAFFVFARLLLFAQKEDKVWITGGGFPFITTFEKDTAVNTYYLDTTFGWGRYHTHGSSCISDSKNGNLLFSCNGMNIYDSAYNFMDGGYKLVPDNIYEDYNGFSLISQSSIILPFDNGIYYVFTPTASDLQHDAWLRGVEQNKGDSIFFDLLLYNVIDMKSNNGLGKVVERMKPLIENGYMMKPEMMACRHANGRDWWLLKGRYNCIEYYTFLVTVNGIEDHGIQKFPRLGKNYDFDIDGQCVFSPDGSKFATVIAHRGTVNLFDFDRCTGKLSNQKAIDVPQLYADDDTTVLDWRTTVGVAFSPNQKYLYISSYSNVLQCELNETDSAKAWYWVNKNSPNNIENNFSNMYLGPNEKLYIGHWHSVANYWNVINFPNEKGALCKWCAKCMKFADYRATTPPCMPNYRLGVLEGSACDTVGKLQAQGLVVYPNPTNGSFTVFVPQAFNTDVYITLHNMLGQTIKQWKKRLDSRQQIQLNIDNIAVGVYTLRVGNKAVKVLKE